MAERMIDIRPVIYVIGLLGVALGIFMLLPMGLDHAAGNGHWWVFLQACVMCVALGGALALSAASGLSQKGSGGMSLRQIFLLTTGVWVAMPLFGALPFMMGHAGMPFVDALFESVSGMTTTGTSVIVGLDDLPVGLHLWRGILQWLGGLGIIIIAMLFLPAMKVGGMQFFRSEGFDTMGKILPSALDISSALVQIYVGLTLACGAAYFALGMSGFDAIVHALTTIATGGFSTTDASFGRYSGRLEYVAVVFMLLSSLPFIRFVQMTQGDWRPLMRDVQVRAFLRWNVYAAGVIAAYLAIKNGEFSEGLIREVLFNTVSIFSGAGYTSSNLGLWGAFPMVILIIVGLIGGCTASTCCSVKVFRYLVLFQAIKAQIVRLHNPSAIVPLHYSGRAIGQDIVDSVIAFFGLFILTLGLLCVALSLTGLSLTAAFTAAWTSLANIGPVFGPEVSGNGAADGFPVSAKWLMIVGMLVGRLELLSVYVLVMRSFWRG